MYHKDKHRCRIFHSCLFVNEEAEITSNVVTRCKDCSCGESVCFCSRKLNAAHSHWRKQHIQSATKLNMLQMTETKYADIICYYLLSS